MIGWFFLAYMNWPIQIKRNHIVLENFYSFQHQIWPKTGQKWVKMGKIQILMCEIAWSVCHSYFPRFSAPAPSPPHLRLIWKRVEEYLRLFETYGGILFSLFLMSGLRKLPFFGGRTSLRMKSIAQKELIFLFQMVPSRILWDQ